MTLPSIQPGDCLLYKGSGVFGFFTRMRTWAPVGHCEVAIGNGRAVAARKLGVQNYPLTTEHLYCVRRPNEPFDLDAALAWFATVRGQRYDTWSLRLFWTSNPAQHGREDAWICSEFETAFYRAGGLEPYSPEYHADRVSPGMFLASPHFKTVWSVAAETEVA